MCLLLCLQCVIQSFITVIVHYSTSLKCHMPIRCCSFATMFCSILFLISNQYLDQVAVLVSENLMHTVLCCETLLLAHSQWRKKNAKKQQKSADFGAVFMYAIA